MEYKGWLLILQPSQPLLRILNLGNTSVSLESLVSEMSLEFNIGNHKTC